MQARVEKLVIQSLRDAVGLKSCWAFGEQTGDGRGQAGKGRHEADRQEAGRRQAGGRQGAGRSQAGGRQKAAKKHA
jgi:hypothetical protein